MGLLIKCRFILTWFYYVEIFGGDFLVKYYR